MADTSFIPLIQLILSTTLFLESGGIAFDGVIRNASDNTQEAYLIPPYKSNHASFLERLPNGDMIMAWFSGKEEGYSDVAIVVSRLLNGTGTWTKAATVSQRKGYSNQNPVLFYDNETSILYLFHTQQEAINGSSRVKMTGEESAEIWVLESLNNGSTWSAPKVMFQRPGSFDRNRIVVSLRNTWLYPIYYAGGSRKDTSYIKESVTHNVFDKWNEYFFTESDHLVQPTVIRPNSSQPKLVAFFRDRRAENIYRAISVDDGKTWSKPSTTTLPNNNSGIQATVLTSGNIAIVYNPTTNVRNPIVISLSADEGQTWPHTRPLDYESEISGSVELSYPTLLQDPMGRIHISYTYNRETIKYRILPNEDWIKERH